MRKRKPQEIIENVRVLDFASEGKCIAKIDGQVIFIEGVAAPGDLVDIQVFKSKNNFKEAKVIKTHELSEMRIEPFCSHFGVCGGCKWQHLPYEKQLELKHKQVVDQLTHIGKVPLPVISPIFPSQNTDYYRNKLEFTFSNYKWLTNEQIASGEEFNRNALGFHIPKRFDKILDVDHCFLQAEPSNQIRLKVKEFALKHNYSFFDAIKMKGFLRNLIIRNSNLGDLMVVVQFAEPNQVEIDRMMDFIGKSFPEITSLNYVVNQKGNDTFLDLQVVCVKGKPYMEEKMNEVIFRIGPKSFFQTNSTQALNLYRITLELAELQGDELVYDLYTGTGTIANFVANHCKHVVGVEYVPEAIEDAKLNSELNKIRNTTFLAGDMRKVLTDSFVGEYGKPDVIITDPPRAGMDKEVVEVILKAEAEKIVYVSCNPATQARDIALLSEKYSVEKVVPVDMFPHTHHVENVALLRLKNG
jgi:23S rRNA (uracil1939-C5)-methyltransferase